jgi:hypothetical protein
MAWKIDEQHQGAAADDNCGGGSAWPKHIGYSLHCSSGKGSMATPTILVKQVEITVEIIQSVLARDLLNQIL